MAWLLAKLLWLIPIGLLVAFLGIVSISFRKPVWRFVVIGVLFTLGGLCSGGFILIGAPGLEDTDVEKPPPRPEHQPVTHIERLRLSWNSEAEVTWPAAETLGLLCQAAYLPPVDAQDSFRRLGFAQIDDVVHASMLGYVVSADDVSVVVFRGSDDNLDWFTNLNALATSTPHGSVHAGFRTALGPLQPQVVKLLDRRKPKHMWIAGHSLGGALAVLCTQQLIENERMAVQGVMTFGQPMVAKEELANYLDRLLLGRYAHFVNGADIVPRVPPAFKHCGKSLSKQAQVDHFIPWSRYPIDLGQNFILAHNTCNNAKSDYLAAEKHLEVWAERNRMHEKEFQERLQTAALPCDLAGTLQIANWAYEQTEKAKGQVWVVEKVLQHLGANWRTRLAG